LNAVIRAVVRKIHNAGGSCLGILEGWRGLVEDLHRPLRVEETDTIIARGGTILGSSRTNPFRQPAHVRRLVDHFRRHELHALVAIGGEDTLGVAHKLHEQEGLPMIGVPKTIDNDLSATEVTFGFDTALQVATDAIDRLHTTAESHHRVMVLEVMGRDAGWIALHAGIAGGAHVILVPEISFTIQNICEKVRERELRGKKFSLVVVAEGVKMPEKDALGKPIPPPKPGNVGNTIAYAVREYTGKETRVTVLGHIQRGGSPSPFDRILATRFGVHAADLVARGEFGRMVCLRCGVIGDVPLQEAIGVYKTVNPESDIVRAARGVGISFGDRV
jgi:6-phosphofructokinase 1